MTLVGLGRMTNEFWAGSGPNGQPNYFQLGSLISCWWPTDVYSWIECSRCTRVSQLSKKYGSAAFLGTQSVIFENTAAHCFQTRRLASQNFHAGSKVNDIVITTANMYLPRSSKVLHDYENLQIELYASFTHATYGLQFKRKNSCVRRLFAEPRSREDWILTKLTRIYNLLFRNFSFMKLHTSISLCSVRLSMFDLCSRYLAISQSLDDYLFFPLKWLLLCFLCLDARC